MADPIFIFDSKIWRDDWHVRPGWRGAYDKTISTQGRQITDKGIRDIDRIARQIKRG